MINDVEISDSHVMVAGNTAADNRTMIIVYDLNGNQFLELGGAESGNPDYLGSITGMAETENGFVAIDGNARKIQFPNRAFPKCTAPPTYAVPRALSEYCCPHRIRRQHRFLCPHRICADINNNSYNINSLSDNSLMRVFR